jgi:hypothetical protein
VAPADPGSVATPSSDRPTWEVQTVFAKHGEAFLREHATTHAQRAALRAIVRCRTAALGGHVDVCGSCDHQRPAYNSCRNRSCPKCQSLAQARWLEGRKKAILPVPHFHLVFTLPAALRLLMRLNPRSLYAALMRVAAGTVLDFGRDPKRLGAEMGVTTVLHTWTRDLSYHPHVHCIVPAGGLGLDRAQWVEPLGLNHDFLFPVRALATTFRARFVAAIRHGIAAGELRLPDELRDEHARGRMLDTLFKSRWNVYCKRSFAGPQ